MSGINYDLTKIKAFVFDVDGVLSPSVIPMSPEGEPLRMANIKDGYALQLAAKHNYKMAIITGGNAPAIQNRFSALGIKDIFQKASHKLEIFEKWISDNDLDPEEVIYIGDDIPDLKCMRVAGLPCAPNDACWEAR
ncbi:MAG: HAD hydrolase-like protein, partial [Muribaculaceae bacterium]|nr:HAD hydrolase-like protein [Muribaculaceae bacterium]